ncbi:hypothetical protein LWM68_15540 [Niabella sp. W65]|nr:hypothetical protein [Niabella sp. W65]MCH7364042.1 hypothetical protein [Niabella sp. W65]
MKNTKTQNKRILLIGFLLLIMTNILGQQTLGYCQSSYSVRKYYEYMQRANSEICRFNNELALQLFDSGFTFIQYPFEIDLNNAVYAAIHSKHPDEKKILHYLDLMRSKHMNLSDKYKSLPGHIHYVNKMNKQSSTPSVVNTYYTNLVADAIATDQVLRNFSYEQFKRPYHNSLLPAIDKIDSVNYNLVDSIFRYALKNHIPLEQLLGRDLNSDLEIIYKHNVAWGRYDKALTDSLIFAGLVDARQYATFYDKNCNSFYKPEEARNGKWGKEFQCNFFCGIYATNIAYQYTDGSAFILMLEPEELEIVNQNRKALFLGNVYDDAKMKIFSYRYSSVGVESLLSQSLHLMLTVF